MEWSKDLKRRIFTPSTSICTTSKSSNMGGRGVKLPPPYRAHQPHPRRY